MYSREVSRHSKKFQSKVAERSDSQTVVIYSLVLTNTTSVYTNSILLNHLQNSTSKHILERLDAYNGLMMTLDSFQVDGMAVFSCGDFTLIKTQEETDNRKKEIQYSNSS